MNLGQSIRFYTEKVGLTLAFQYDGGRAEEQRGASAEGRARYLVGDTGARHQGRSGAHLVLRGVPRGAAGPVTLERAVPVLPSLSIERTVAFTARRWASNR